jgi:hypothetical protein
MTSPPRSQPNSEPEPRLANGEFYAKRDKIFRAPIKTKTDSGTRISVGFPVCHVSDYVDPANLVECLNASREVDGLKARVVALEVALEKVRSYNVDIAAGRINYRPHDHIQVIDEALYPESAK